MALNNDEYYELLELDEIERELAILNAYDSFWDFCLYMDYGFFTSRQQVVQPICEAFQEVTDGKLDLLYIGLPPRTGKSYIASLWCAWMLGHYPSESIMRNTVTSTLYDKFSGDIRNMMQGDTHKSRYNTVFPDIKFATEKLEGWKLTESRVGVSYFGGGVGGSVIGMGATLAALIDDSVKNAEEAFSENALQKKWDWYGSTHNSRREKVADGSRKCPEIHIATRWSNQDIPGRLMTLGKFNDERAKQIVVPAMIDNKSYCEEIHSTKDLLNEKLILDELLWESEWMQNPIEAKGLLFPMAELNRYNIADLNQRPDGIFCVGDIADEGSDSLGVPIAYKYGNKYYIVDVLFTTDKIEITQPLTAAMIDKYKPDKIRFESNNGGKNFSLEVQKLITVPRKVKWKATTTNKHTRIIMKSGFVKEYFYFREDIQAGSMYDKYFKELTTYNKTGKVKHDDAADCTTMMAELVDNKNDWNW